MTLYRDIIKQAFKTTWHNKYLWFFGIFAALLGNGGELELLFHRFDTTVENGLFPFWASIANTGFFGKNTFLNIGHLATRDPLSLFLVLTVFVVILILGALAVWLTVVSQASLVSGAAQIRVGKKHDFKTALDAGINRFYGVFGLNLILKLLVYLFFIFLSLPLLAAAGNRYLFSSTAIFMVAFLFFVTLAMVISFIVKYAIAFYVIKRCGFLESIRLAWQLFMRNWLISLEMAFLLFVINIIVGLGLILLLLVFTVPFLFLALVLSKLAFYFNFWIVVASALILYLVVIIIVGAALSTFQISSWTGLYLELVSRGGASKLTRIFNKE